MKHLIEFKMEDSSTIVIEVDEPEIGGTTRASRTGDMIEEAKETFEQALSKIRPVTERITTMLHGLVNRPNEIEIEFGFNLSATAGIVIASASTTANYKVILRWKDKEQEPK